MIIPNEVTELTVEDYELLVSRLHRAPKAPYTQILADCNPDAPTHWVYSRMTAGKIHSIKGRHEDNPALFDHERGTWTPNGADYIGGLDSLTGVRYKRLRLGEWASAEGIVFDRWDPETNLWNDQQLIERGILAPGGYSTGAAVAGVIAAVDWGYTKPGVLTVWAYDRDGRAYCIFQIYQTQRLMEWWKPQFAKAAERFHIRHFVADPSEPEYIAQCNAFKGIVGKFQPAQNGIQDGINAVNERMVKKGDGYPRFVIRRDSLDQIDESLRRKAQPTCLQEEIPVYVWSVRADQIQRVQTETGRREQPIDEYNHACDTARYAMLDLDGRGSKTLRAQR